MRQAIAILVLATLAGCMEVRVDQGTVFAPVAFDAGEAAATGERIRDERAFADPALWRAAWTYRVERGLLTEPAPEFVPTQVEHGVHDGAGGGIVWSRLSREGEGRPLIVRCGGNASTRQQTGFLYSVSALMHGDVLLFDYPGSGETGGEATPERFAAMRDDLLALVRQQAGDRRLVLWGHSLGGFVCSELATGLPHAAGVILEGTARNPAEVAKAWTPWYAGPFVDIVIEDSLAAYDNAVALAGYGGPVLVLGGRKDGTLPVRLARDLHKALAADGRDVTYVEFPNGVHSDFPGQPEFPGVITDFFARLR